MDDSRDDSLSRVVISDWLQKVQLHGIDQGKEVKEVDSEVAKK